jgi:hypothetical protein
MSSTVNQRKDKYLLTDEGQHAKRQLEEMAASTKYNTRSSYSPNQDDVTFVEKHLSHLSQHAYLQTHEYIANLKLMTKKRG